MSKPWTRKHDAHIARECEGFEVHSDARGEFYYRTPHQVNLVPQYNIDKIKRAAEAWRKQDEPSRFWLYLSPKSTKPAKATFYTNTLDEPAVAMGENACAWALYKITEGKDF